MRFVPVAAGALMILASCQEGSDSTTAAVTQAGAPVDALEAVLPPATYELDPTHAAMLVSVPHNRGISDYTVRFGRVTGQLKLNPQDPESSSIVLEIDPASVGTSYPGDYKAARPGAAFANWDEELVQSEKFLNALKFPAIRFTSTKVVKTGDHTADVTGDLNFLGVTKPVTMQVTYKGGLEKHPFAPGAAAGFSAEGSFKRSDFGMPASGVGDVATVRFNGEFIQQAGQ